MNIRTRIGKLETAIGRCLSAREMSEAQLEAVIRKAEGLGGDVEITDELLRLLSGQAHSAEAATQGVGNGNS